MHSICHTPAFTSAAHDAGMSDAEIEALEDFLARNPSAGEEMQGTGGCRKVRWGLGSKGKRGGVRTITFFTGDEFPVFLITVFGKGEQANLTKKERNFLEARTKVLVAEYRKKVVKVGAGP